MAQQDGPSPCSDDPEWLVAATHVHSEAIAVANLQRQGFTTYCPLLRKRRSHARKVDHVLRPLFPGYVFVRLDAAGRHWRPILSTAGVRTLVRFGEAPATLADGFIARLRAREEDGAVVRPAVPYAVGQDVQIEGGPLDGLVARILSLDDKDRIVVLLDVMNRGVRARVDSRRIWPITG